MTLAKSSPSFKSPHSNTPRDCESTYGRINKDKTLPAGQSFAFGIVEERGEFLVNLDHRQQPREAGAEAPDKPVLAIAHPFHARP